MHHYGNMGGTSQLFAGREVICVSVGVDNVLQGETMLGAKAPVMVNAA
jgi:hypothetical protein